MNWKLKIINKVELSKDSILISGLPGVGNVGKLAVDFLVDDLNAKRVYEISSPNSHNCVFVNDDNLVELPFLSIYHKKMKNKDLFFLSGDIQPLDGSSCHSFCNEIIKFCKINNCNEIITLGGVGMKDVPKRPKLYFTGNNKEIIDRYNNKKTLSSLTGQIVGVSGLLVGLAGSKKIKGLSILAETFAQPNYIGTKGAKAILNALENKLKLGLNLKRMKEEMKELELNNEELEDMDFWEGLQEQVSAVSNLLDEDTSYIG